MKIHTLFLHAFGPFTQTVLDFSGSAQLHLVYGPNEAGKSSALRAMGDLRYGIHAQSKDDFLHAYREMSLAGTFVDASGQLLGLARRKGNKDTLLLADPQTGAPLAGSTVTPAMLLALTGGVDRQQFDTLYALDAERLRKGGQQLIQGEGELGAALFEASTGTAGIQAMLATLANDAKRYYAPRGQTMVLNEAARQLDEAQQRYKKAITRPEQWKQLERAQQEAQQQLSDIRTQLTSQRQRVAQLAELRAVEPLLRDLDAAAQHWQQVQGSVALAADAREQRLAAQEQARQAQEMLQAADAALHQCQQDLQGQSPEPLLLAHSGAIERLHTDAAQVRRTRDEVARLQAITHTEAEQLRAQAERLGVPVSAGHNLHALHSLHAISAQMPSADEHSAAEQALQQMHDARHSLHSALAQQEALTARQQQLQQLQQQAQALVSPQQQQALSLALQRALSLGDAEPRREALQRAADADQRKLQQTLKDMGLTAAQDLSARGHLASARIDDYEQAQNAWHSAAALDHSELQTLDKHLAEQQRRRAGLGAVGEVITAATLQQARALREQNWQGVRAAFVVCASPTPANHSALVQDFERAQNEADRQADLLREGAQRAAQITECEQRIAEMQQAQQALIARQAERQTALAASQARWAQTLAQAGVPLGGAAEVREWLQLRHSALEQQERWQQKSDEQTALQAQIDSAQSALCAALAALGAVIPPDASDLASQVALGTALERDLVRQRAAIEQRSQDLADVAQGLQAQARQVAQQQQQVQASQNALSVHCQRLYLCADAAPAQVRAQCQAMRDWSSAYLLHHKQLLQLHALQAHASALASDAAALGARLNEPLSEPIELWVDALARRLAQSREASALHAALRKTEAAEHQRQQRAQALLASAQQTLAALCAQAQVGQAEALPEAEDQSQQRRAAEQRWQASTLQLAKTSAQDANALRAALAQQDSAALDQEKQACIAHIEQLEGDEKTAIATAYAAQQALAAIDTSDAAALAREEMESAVARYRAGVRPWAQLKLAHALLSQALRRHREQAQGPVLALASGYFCQMTGGRFARLLVDADGHGHGENPLLLAQPEQGAPIGIAALSEGTADQLHLALRLAALQVQRQPERQTSQTSQTSQMLPMPLVLDDVLMTADDARAAQMLQALAQFAAQQQVLVFTHHRHLLEIAKRSLPAGVLRVHTL